ncbi:MAG: hypothetical protein ACFFFH_07355 [Candidatus Thorarchaeota archaeon]
MNILKARSRTLTILEPILNIIGLDFFKIMILVILPIVSYILPKDANWIFNYMPARDLQQEYESSETDASIDSNDFTEEITCPNCCYMDDGLYYSNYGSRLRWNG